MWCPHTFSQHVSNRRHQRGLQMPRRSAGLSPSILPRGLPGPPASRPCAQSLQVQLVDFIETLLTLPARRVLQPPGSSKVIAKGEPVPPGAPRRVRTHNYDSLRTTFALPWHQKAAWGTWATHGCHKAGECGKVGGQVRTSHCCFTEIN